MQTGLIRLVGRQGSSDASSAQPVAGYTVQGSTQPPRPPAAPENGHSNSAFAAEVVQQLQLQQQQQALQEQAAADAAAAKPQHAGVPGRPAQMMLASSCSSAFEQQEDDAAEPLSQTGSLGSMANSRRTSWLSDSGRASRMSSQLTDGGMGGPPAAQPQLAPPPPQPLPTDEPFWANSSWSFGQHSDQNQRRHMEDRIACRDLTEHPGFAGCRRAGFFAVFDGHGGHEAAEYLEQHLLGHLLAGQPDELRADPLAALGAAVSSAEAEILSRFAASCCKAGSTLLALLLVDGRLFVANVGDSRAVLGRGAEPHQLTRDHKPACSLEAARIEADDPGAEISTDGYMYGELGVARAIGSCHLKADPSKRALIPTPDLLEVALRPEDDFVVLASDGLWDKVDNGEVVQVMRRSLAAQRDPGVAARALVDRALRRASYDNIAVVTLLLHGRPISMPKSNSMLFKRQALSGLPGGDSPRCSTPCSGVSTPAVTTPRSGTPSGQHIREREPQQQ